MTASDLGIKLIVGLGNPGEEYANTYHNLGALALDFLVKSISKNTCCSAEKEDVLWQKGPKSKKFSFIKKNNIIFVKNSTFMNVSGEAVASAAEYFQSNPENILIIHDDADIDFGKYRLSFGSRSAGHKGIESAIKTLKTQNFYRIRIGIRKETNPKTGHKKAGSFVLRSISKKDLATLNNVFEKIKTDLFGN
jgi:PTH1 family peptidyl-tRNA hydrolase